jgi:hypothetical protein
VNKKEERKKEMAKTLLSPSKFLESDIQELYQKGLLDGTQRDKLLGQLLRHQIVDVQISLRQFYQQELNTIIHDFRTKQNKTHEETLVSSDLIAIAAGGLFGAVSAWMRTPSSTSNNNNEIKDNVISNRAATSSIWASAFDSAHATLKTCRQRRMVEHFEIKYICGDESKAKHVVFVINGFMTQGFDPMQTWRPLVKLEECVFYAVIWEAGDQNVWNDFCAHVNDKLASNLLTHFTGNPWHTAQDKAEQIGVLLARIIAMQPTFVRQRKISLFGHSLGGMVIYSALKELSQMRKNGQLLSQSKDHHVALIYQAVFFAGAFTTDDRNEFEKAVHEVAKEGKIINVYSESDAILTKIYRATKLHEVTGGVDPSSIVAAAGCAPLRFLEEKTLPHGMNFDVTSIVLPKLQNAFGHSYGENMSQIVDLLLPHLDLM